MKKNHLGSASLGNGAARSSKCFSSVSIDGNVREQRESGSVDQRARCNPEGDGRPGSPVKVLNKVVKVLTT